MRSPLAAFTVPGAAKAINAQIEDLVKAPGVTEVSAKYRNGDRHVAHERYDFLRPTVVHCSSTEPAIANTEYMFPFCSVVKCAFENCSPSRSVESMIANCSIGMPSSS